MYTTCVRGALALSPRLALATAGIREPSSMEFQDKVLTCIDCGALFTFTAGEQLFFYDKQFKNEPKRCKSCKSKRVAVLNSNPPPRDGHQRHSRIETRATCSQCGKETTIPFKPTQGRPIFCRECFMQKRSVASA
jgi:CxxC-x17-CxxC domain-containing protein